MRWRDEAARGARPPVPPVFIVVCQRHAAREGGPRVAHRRPGRARRRRSRSSATRDGDRVHGANRLAWWWTRADIRHGAQRREPPPPLRARHDRPDRRGRAIVAPRSTWSWSRSSTARRPRTWRPRSTRACPRAGTCAASYRWPCSRRAGTATTVTHIVGLRPFQSQLLCEQVIGRGLRRSQYARPDGGRGGEGATACRSS